MSEFIQSLPGCEEHGKVFKDEVSVRLYCNMFLNVSKPGDTTVGKCVKLAGRKRRVIKEDTSDVTALQVALTTYRRRGPKESLDKAFHDHAQ